MHFVTAVRAFALSGLGLIASGCGGYGSGDYDYGPVAPQRLVRGALSGGAATTVVDPNAAGESLFEVRSDGTVTFAVTAEAAWLGDVTGVSVHRGPPGNNGPVEVDLMSGGATFDPLTRTATGSIDVGTSLAAEMINYPDYFYVNVTTTGAPGGLVRGQVGPAFPFEVHATLRGTEATTVADASARGAATFSVGADRTVHYVVAMGSPAIGQLTAAVLHSGAIGVDGPVAVDLGIGSGTQNASESTVTGSFVAPVDVLCRLAHAPSDLYVAVATAAVPAGIARGQLSTEPVSLWAALTGSAEVVVVDASARGGVTLELTSFTSGRAIYAVPAAQGIAAVNGAHIHLGALLVNGPSVIDLRAGADFTTGAASAEGSISLTQSLYARLIAAPSAFYAQLHTAAAPFGLVRGQLNADPATFRASMLGSLETNVIDAAASGTAKLIVTGPRAASFHIAMNSPPATTLIGAHVHEGAAGTNGPIRVDFLGGIDVSTSPTLVSGKVTLTGPIFASLLAAPALFYANVHTALAPDGVCRNQFVRITDSSAPSALSYTTPVVYTVGTPITPNLPSNSGGAVASYAITPGLPQGLSFDTATGAITGTPTAISPTTVYTVTAFSATGSTNTVLSITVNLPSPANLTYATPVTYVVGTPITPNVPSSTGGAIASYSVLPALPAGLVLDVSTGVISGTPTLAAAQADYTVTGSNVTGSTNAVVKITVTLLLTPPTGLSYTTPVSYGTGTAIANNSPTVGGGPVASYSVLPALPAGLSLHATTGVISGTPTAVTSQAGYTVTASNAAGDTTAVVTITVTLGAPTNLSYTNSPALGYVTPASFPGMTPSASGGAIASYSISPALPAGLTLNTTSGVISGTPTATSPYTGYTVTATNAAGSTNTTIYITVL